MKEPIEFSIASMTIILILLLTVNLLNLIYSVEFKVNIKAKSLMNKLELTIGSPSNWDESIILGGKIVDFGLSSLNGLSLDKDKVNLITYNYIGSIKFLRKNPLYIDPLAFKKLLNIKNKEFRLDFKPALNITIKVSRIKLKYRIEVKIYDLNGKDLTSKASITYLIVYSYRLETKYAIYINGPPSISVSGSIRALAVIANVNGIKSIAYWLYKFIPFGIIIGSYIISPIPLSLAEGTLLFCEYMGKDFKCNVKLRFIDRIGEIFIYKFYNDNWSKVVSHNIDDKVVMLIVNTIRFKVLLSIFLAYSAPIYYDNNFSGLPKLSYGNLNLPVEYSVERRFVLIGEMNYEIKLYLWRIEK